MSDGGALSLLGFALALLGVALFLLSTRQGRWPFRLVAWLAALACLAGAAWAASRIAGHYGFLRAIMDAWDQRHDPGKGVLALALQRNLASIQEYAPPLLDFAIVIALLLGLVCLIAFSPGEAIERRVRPFLIGVLGAILGASATLIIVAIGFGGEADRRNWVGIVRSSTDVYNGDTIWIGTVSLRLFGIDAPELSQVCLGKDQQILPCGADARTHLSMILNDALVICDTQQTARGSTRESFGRPLASCEARTPMGASVQVAEAMSASGWGIVYRDAQGRVDPKVQHLCRHEAAAQQSRLGLWNTSFVPPRTWRTDTVLRRSAKENGKDAFQRTPALAPCPSASALAD
jgi:endonuclease YncB( thermonuclease family)